jgi:hypothetical protein
MGTFKAPTLGPFGWLRDKHLPPNLRDGNIQTFLADEAADPASPLAGELSATIATKSASTLGVVRPEEFGAKGDWVDTSTTQGTGTDDTAAFQAAVDWLLANGGGTLLLTKKYRIDGTVYINQTDYQVIRPITIKGSGGQGSRTNGTMIARQTTGDIFCVNLAAMGGSIVNKALTSNVATLTTASAHGLTVGATVVISGVDTTFNGAFVVTTVPTSTTFTFALTADNVASTAVSTPTATAKKPTLPPDETTAGFRAEGFSVVGRRTNPAVVVQGVNLFNMWRVRSTVFNIYSAWIDYTVLQEATGVYGSTDNYCDQSSFEQIFTQFSSRGALKLFLSDASTVKNQYFESPGTTAIGALDVRGAQGFSVDGFLAWHPFGTYTPQAGSSIIDLRTCRAVKLSALHIERSQMFEYVIRARNVRGLQVDALASYWDTGTFFRLENCSLVKVRNWYSDETRLPGTYDLSVSDSTTTDVEFEHTAFHDHTAPIGGGEYATRAMLVQKPAGPIPNTVEGVGLKPGMTRMAYKFANSSQSLNNTLSFIHGDAAAGAITLTLPPATENQGKVFTIVKTDSTANLIAIAPQGSDSIRDIRGSWTTGSPYNLAVQGYAVTMVAGATTWYVTASVPSQNLRTTYGWDPASVAAGASLKSPNITLSSAALGMPVVVGASGDLQGLTVTAYVSAANTVNIVLTNLTGAAVDLGSLTWTVKALPWP